MRHVWIINEADCGPSDRRIGSPYPCSSSGIEYDQGKGVAMAKTDTIRDRVDAALKVQAEAVLKELGLTASDAIRLFYKQVALQKGLPFEIKIPNAATRRALKDADARRNLTRYENFDDFTKAMKGE
jgi:DNA-damage-inducible protein J